MNLNLPERSTTFVRRDDCWEVDFLFEPNPELAHLFESYSANPRVLFSVEEDGELNCSIVEGEPTGWRIPVGDGFVYTHVDIDHLAPAEAHRLASTTHSHLLALRLYYPSHDDLLAYWACPADTKNSAEDYLTPVGRSEYLGGVIETHCPNTASALEIGCNVGRNLNYLATVQGMKVAGIEYSDHAIRLLRQTYRGLDESTVYSGDAVQQIKRIDDKSFDLVFSMAVLMHLHPSTPDEFFVDLARVARKHLIFIENCRGGTERSWSRDYKAIIEGSGVATQIHEGSPPCEFPEFDGYTTHVFKVL
jgi:SAM-dependent methyltransferase